MTFKIRELRSKEVTFKSYGTAVNTSYLNGMQAMFRFEIPYAAALTPDLTDGNSCPVSGNYFPYIFKCSYVLNMLQRQTPVS